MFLKTDSADAEPDWKRGFLQSELRAWAGQPVQGGGAHHEDQAQRSRNSGE
jgi:hypothetical protein